MGSSSKPHGSWLAHATDLFEEGWWIVEIQWYERVEQGKDASARKYKLLPDSKRLLAVNALIRVGGLEFEGGQRVPKSGIRVLCDHSREVVEECL